MGNEQVTSNQRARPNREDWPLTPEGDNLFNHHLQMWQYEEIERLRNHLRQKSEQITRLQDGIEKLQQGSAERAAHEPAAPLRFKIGDRVKWRGWPWECTIDAYGYVVKTPQGHRVNFEEYELVASPTKESAP